MTAGQKWLRLLFDVLGYEFDEGPLLSEGADTLVERYPVLGRVFIVCVGAQVVFHLANMIDPRYDIMAKSFWKVNRR